jgi:hypothetical protein
MPLLAVLLPWVKLSQPGRAKVKGWVNGPSPDHLRNAKLQLTAVLVPEEEVPGLYLHPDHRRRLHRAPVRSTLDV